jgi:hypothetical protein
MLQKDTCDKVREILCKISLLKHHKCENVYTDRAARLLKYVQGGSNMTGTNCDLFTHK